MAAIAFLLTQTTLPTEFGQPLLIAFSAGCIAIILRGHKRDQDALDALTKKRDDERAEQLLGIRSSTEAMNEMGVSVRGVTEGLNLLVQKVTALDASITTVQKSVDEMYRKIASP